MCFPSLLDELLSWDDKLCLPEAAGYGDVKQSAFVPSLTWNWTLSIKYSHGLFLTMGTCPHHHPQL